MFSFFNSITIKTKRVSIKLIKFFKEVWYANEVIFMARTGPKLPQKILVYSAVVYAIVFLIMLGLSLFFSIPFSIGNGWILGAIIASLNYGSILLQASRLQARIQANITTPYYGQGYAFARLALSAAGMLLAVFIKLNDVVVFNLFSVFAAYLIISLVIYVTGAQVKATKVSV